VACVEHRAYDGRRYLWSEAAGHRQRTARA